MFIKFSVANSIKLSMPRPYIEQCKFKPPVKWLKCKGTHFISGGESHRQTNHYTDSHNE